MSNDPLIRALRRFSYCAGVTLLVVPIVSLSLDIMDLRTLPPRLSRSVLGFMAPLALANVSPVPVARIGRASLSIIVAARLGNERAEGNGFLLSLSRCPQRRHRDEPELVAERHHLVAQVEHHSGAELLTQLIPQRFERREVRRRHGGAALDLDRRD